ncbi:MAG: cation:proton antiporter [Planctomycetota bacterium]|jgi:Kef-type K+ transport system membrane component KefB
MLPFLQIILVIALIITLAKAGGYLSYKLGQPAVVGEVLAGLIIGPSVMNILNWSVFTDAHLGETITHFAELGVLLLLFIAGLDLHLSDLVKSGKTASMTGGVGFVLTLGMGYILALLFSFDAPEALFIGLILAPTSIGISAQTLMELKVLRTKVGTTMLGAAVVDDTLGVLGVSLYIALFLGGATGGAASLWLILLKMILYLIIASAIGLLLLPKLAQYVDKLPISQGLIAFAFAVALFYAWSAEALGHMAAIIGAFMAGLFLARSPLKDKIERGLSSIAYGVFVPIFFINVGLSANVRQITADGLWLLAGMILVVIFSKLIGAGLSGRLGGMTKQESLQLGFGMIPRGEVVLIIAAVGITEGLINSGTFSTIVVLVIITTIMTPPILRNLFSKDNQSNI